MISNKLGAKLCVQQVNRETGGPDVLMRWFSCDTWHWRPITRWLFKKKKTSERKRKSGRGGHERKQRLLFSFFSVSPHSLLPPLFPEGPSSARLRARHPFWNMQIADSAFACWCLTFPLEVARRLNYAPLSAVCLKTPVILPQSATLRQSLFSTSRPQRVCLKAVWTREGAAVAGGVRGGRAGNGWWRSLTSAAAPRFLLRHVLENHLCQYNFPQAKAWSKEQGRNRPLTPSSYLSILNLAVRYETLGNAFDLKGNYCNPAVLEWTLQFGWILPTAARGELLYLVALEKTNERFTIARRKLESSSSLFQSN